MYVDLEKICLNLNCDKVWTETDFLFKVVAQIITPIDG